MKLRFVTFLLSNTWWRIGFVSGDDFEGHMNPSQKKHGVSFILVGMITICFVYLTSGSNDEVCIYDASLLTGILLVSLNDGLSRMHIVLYVE